MIQKLPQDLACERALIGAILCGMDPLPPLRPEEFFKEHHRLIWAACQEVERLDGRCTQPTVTAALHRRGELAEIGGLAYLAGCVEEGCAVTPLEGLARVIRDLARDRELVRLGLELQGLGLSQEQIQARLAALPGPIGQGIWDPLLAWETVRQRWGQHGPRTGWGELDALAPLYPGILLVVAGRTSHGKTAFSTAAAVRMALDAIAVDLITLEDPVEAIVLRQIATLTGLSYRRLRTGDISHDQGRAADLAADRLRRLPLHVTGIDRHAQATEEGVLGLLAASTGQVVILDHLQRVQTKDPSRAYALERVLGRIHAHVQRTGQVAWVNCQLNRQVEARKDGEPTLADLRDSGAIEIMARQVWLLSWPRRWDPKAPWGAYRINVAKNSDGATGRLDLQWHPPSGRFWTAEEGPPPDQAQAAPAWVTETD